MSEISKTNRETMGLRIAICDDDAVDRDSVRTMVSDYVRERGISAEIRTFDHPDTLLTECERYRPQIYILDIVMPMINGIQAARELRWNQPDAQIIFATSEKSFALESFDVNPINYILKPIQKEKLYSTMDLAITHAKTEIDQTLTIKVKGGYQTMRIDEIMYIDYRNHVVSYHLASGDVVATPTLRIGFTEYLTDNHVGQDFVRCHESISANVSAIDKLTKTDITLRNKEIIPVAKSRYADVAESYMNYRFS